MSKKNQSKSVPQIKIDSEPFWLKYGWIILLFVSISCWFSSINLGLTQLDDSLLIGNREYLTSNWNNIFYLFKVGCFHDKDVYYRPILSIYFFILNFIFGTESMMPYHFFSVLIHAINVLLVFKFLQKIILHKENAFLLTLIFAVHPAFTMAISWIPGVNDLLLMMFAMVYFLALIKYFQTSKIIYLITIVLSLFIALFTKENGVFLPFVVLLMLWHKNYFNKSNVSKIIVIALITIIGWSIWYFIRMPVIKETADFRINYKEDFVLRLLSVFHYLGKAILPFNLSTIPTTNDTNFLFGLISFIFLVIGVALNQIANRKNIALGLGWFLILFMVVFALPTHNKKYIIEYEHRLYLPFIGILILINESMLFKKLNLLYFKRIFILAALIISSLLVNNYSKAFNDAESFWTNAANNSPNSAFAFVNLGSRQLDAGNTNEAIVNFKRAFAIDSTERFVGFYLARTIYIPEKNFKKARYYIYKEMAKNPNYPDLYIALSQINFYENDFIEEEKNLEKYISINKNNVDINMSLYKLAIQLHHFEKAKLIAEKLINSGVQIPVNDLRIINDSILLSKSKL